MKKGISPIIVSVLLIVVVMGLAFTFLIWGNQLSETFDETSREGVERDINELNSAIVISTISGNQIDVRNLGQPELSVETFSVFVNDNLVSITSRNPSTGTISTDETVRLTISTSAACEDVKVTGQYDTSDEYPANEQPGC